MVVEGEVEANRCAHDEAATTTTTARKDRIRQHPARRDVSLCAQDSAPAPHESARTLGIECFHL
jgi:hypothetical protein